MEKKLTLAFYGAVDIFSVKILEKMNVPYHFFNKVIILEESLFHNSFTLIIKEPEVFEYPECQIYPYIYRLLDVRFKNNPKILLITKYKRKVELVNFLKKNSQWKIKIFHTPPNFSEDQIFVLLNGTSMKEGKSSDLISFPHIKKHFPYLLIETKKMTPINN